MDLFIKKKAELDENISKALEDEKFEKEVQKAEKTLKMAEKEIKTLDEKKPQKVAIKIDFKKYLKFLATN